VLDDDEGQPDVLPATRDDSPYLQPLPSVDSLGTSEVTDILTSQHTVKCYTSSAKDKKRRVRGRRQFTK